MTLFQKASKFFSSMMCCAVVLSLPLCAMQGRDLGEAESRSVRPAAPRIVSMSSLKAIQNKIQGVLEAGLLPEKLGVIIDFHGVIVREIFHNPPLSLNPEAKEFLAYLKRSKIPFVVATAWDNFDEVLRDGVLSLELAELLDVKDQEKIEEQEFRKRS